MKAVRIRNISWTLIASCLVLLVSTSLHSCKVSQAVADKSGAQLWAENCQRCHNIPSPASYTAEQWETIGMHMQTRAMLTTQERKKIVDFLKQ